MFLHGLEAAMTSIFDPHQDTESRR